MKETEKALIGALVGDPSQIPIVSAAINTTDFSDIKARKAYEAILSLFNNGTAVDPVTVGSSSGVDFMYVTESTGVGFWSSALQYAKDIASRAKSKRIKSTLAEILKGDSPSRMLRDMTSLYNREACGGGKSPDMDSILSRFDNYRNLNMARGSVGFNTGIAVVDKAMVYYVAGQIWTMGGYTSTGKTAMMVQMIVNLFRNNPGVKVCLISTEMTEEQMIGRMLGNMSGIYSQKILSGDIFPTEEEAYASAYSEIKAWDLKIHDDINEMSEIESATRGHDMRGGVDVVFVDYVQNCCVSGINNSYMEQKILATSMQQLAKTTNSTFVCLSQVSNAVGRGDVGTFELKGAGEWAAVSDIGIMLKRGCEDERELLFSVPKNRHGTKPNVIFKFNGNYSNLTETGEVFA